MSGKRRELFVSEIRDYLKLMEISYIHYKDEEHSSKVTAQIKKIADICIKLVSSDTKIIKNMVDFISLYVESLKTFDRKIIIQSGRNLLEILK